MRFTIYGAEFDTDTMRRFPTGNPDEPFIYMDQYCRVFAERVKAGNAAVHWLLTPEIAQIARRYGLADVERAMRHTDSD